MLKVAIAQQKQTLEYNKKVNKNRDRVVTWVSGGASDLTCILLGSPPSRHIFQSQKASPVAKIAKPPAM